MSLPSNSIPAQLPLAPLVGSAEAAEHPPKIYFQDILFFVEMLPSGYIPKCPLLASISIFSCGLPGLLSAPKYPH